MFKSTYNKGYNLLFKNGLTISVQFGHNNYCSNHDISAFEKPDILSSYDAEIAIWDANGQWFNFGHDTVKGHIDSDEVAVWTNLVAKSSDLTQLKLYANMNKLMDNERFEVDEPEFDSAQFRTDDNFDDGHGY
jgi:hypothetical protein